MTQPPKGAKMFSHHFGPAHPNINPGVDPDIQEPCRWFRVVRLIQKCRNIQNVSSNQLQPGLFVSVHAQCGVPDASSVPGNSVQYGRICRSIFPTGTLRSTHLARGLHATFWKRWSRPELPMTGTLGREWTVHGTPRMTHNHPGRGSLEISAYMSLALILQSNFKY